MTKLQNVIIASGLLAARPAFGSEGRLYYATDVPMLYRDTGAAWEQYAPSGGGASGDEYYGRNLVKNSPGQIVTDGSEPQWWDDVANATLTDEDTAGETPPDIHERCFKVVTIANDVYGYQTLTFADEELLDAGVTEVSFGCWVYCGTAAKASIGIYGTNLGLEESSQAGAGAWEWLAVEGVTIDAADTSIEIRLIVDTSTAWFTMPMLAVGPNAQPWAPRSIRYVPTSTAQVYDHNGTGDIAWSDADASALVDPLSLLLQLRSRAYETNNSGTSHYVGHHDDLLADAAVVAAQVQSSATFIDVAPTVMCNDGQVFRYSVNEGDADNDAWVRSSVQAYWMWG